MTPISLDNGLKPHHQQQLIAILSNHPHVEHVWLFGSRAMGNFKATSDIDLVIQGEQLTLTDRATLLATIELTTIPYQVDLLIKHAITNTKLLEHIEEHGVQWF